jgi:hypothetical protein
LTQVVLSQRSDGHNHKLHFGELLNIFLLENQQNSVIHDAYIRLRMTFFEAPSPSNRAALAPRCRPQPPSPFNAKKKVPCYDIIIGGSRSSFHDAQWNIWIRELSNAKEFCRALIDNGDF